MIVSEKQVALPAKEIADGRWRYGAFHAGYSDTVVCMWVCKSGRSNQVECNLLHILYEARMACASARMQCLLEPTQHEQTLGLCVREVAAG